MRTISGTFLGTGAALYLGLGFKPDFFRLENLEVGTNHYWLEWNRAMRAAECQDGVLAYLPLSAGSGDINRLTVGTGIALYDGGDLISAAAATHKILDPEPNKLDANVASGAAAISTWTLGSAANRTGNWNAECNTSYVGEGSTILIRENATGALRETWVQAMSSNGDQANEVTLAPVLPGSSIKSGVIEFLGGLYDYVNAPAGTVMPAGVYIADTTVNAANRCFFIAGTW
jgi:hypothetical protein